MVEDCVIPEQEASGWMRRCILIGAVHQSDVWISALQVAAFYAGQDMVLLQECPVRPEMGDDARIFVACDRRNFVVAEDADCVVVLDGVERVVGIGSSYDEQARVRLIEISRQAVEALCWSKSKTTITTATADAAKHGKLLNFLGLSVRPPEPHPFINDAEDARAMAAISYLEAAAGEAYWPSDYFIYDRAPLELTEEAAVLDMTGPPRPLLRGPYLWAPIGRWHLTARFSVDNDGAHQEIQFRWGPPLKPTIFRAAMEKSGIYELELEAEWSEIDGMEFTIALAHGCVAGKLIFLGAAVKRLK